MGEEPVRVGSPDQKAPTIWEHTFNDGQNTYYRLQSGQVGGKHYHLRLGEKLEREGMEPDEGDLAKNPEYLHLMGGAIILVCWDMDDPTHPVLRDEVIDASQEVKEVVIEPHVGHVTICLRDGWMVEPKVTRFNPNKPGTVRISEEDLPQAVRQRIDSALAREDYCVPT